MVGKHTDLFSDWIQISQAALEIWGLPKRLTLERGNAASIAKLWSDTSQNVKNPYRWLRSSKVQILKIVLKVFS